MSEEFLLGGEMATILNPMPAVTLGEVEEMAGFRRGPASQTHAFSFDLRWSGGEHKQSITLDPGQKRQVMAFAALEWERREFGEMGFVMIRPGESENDARIRGLEAAIAFYGQARSDLLTEQTRRGLDDEKWAALRGNWRGLYVNVAKAELLEKELEKLRHKIEWEIDQEPVAAEAEPEEEEDDTPPAPVLEMPCGKVGTAKLERHVRMCMKQPCIDKAHELGVERVRPGVGGQRSGETRRRRSEAWEAERRAQREAAQ